MCHGQDTILLQTPLAVFRVFVEMVGNLCCFPICMSLCKPASPSPLETTWISHLERLWIRTEMSIMPLANTL